MEQTASDFILDKLLEEANIAIKDKNRTLKDSLVAHEQEKIIESFSKKDEEYTRYVVAAQFISLEKYANAIPHALRPRRLFKPIWYTFYERIDNKKRKSLENQKYNSPEKIYLQACKCQQLLEKEVLNKVDILNERLKYIKSLNLMLIYLKDAFVNMV